MEDQDWQQRYIRWLEYWCRAIVAQHAEDKNATVTDSSTKEGYRPLYRDDTDRAINGLIVASLLEEIDRLERQIKRVQ